ncbi:hypothetical protein GLOTRDRAFT_132476 [Gloeophyllum trabeum ATCC 11539]|uniref:Uncharacterized protein n=1 Tax=Gloeophyllum trabeum (strain ATCC 11539 / FP-39264 / Madison 617) TaxID=670483 RepID=S7PXW7_GLOTA|nr:uncharacterized protein GLOTRDRAFT_132476 [Gloeophyllum trabeum ATCC 11539]EPQ52363.1 hypothetical protein GLOTRDRAFT_132476 [Gloeophyllum trabeum ATCC 11539]
MSSGRSRPYGKARLQPLIYSIAQDQAYARPTTPQSGTIPSFQVRYIALVTHTPGQFQASHPIMVVFTFVAEPPRGPAPQGTSNWSPTIPATPPTPTPWTAGPMAARHEHQQESRRRDMYK